MAVIARRILLGVLGEQVAVLFAGEQPGGVVVFVGDVGVALNRRLP
jgi:hypothetical protein